MDAPILSINSSSSILRILLRLIPKAIDKYLYFYSIIILLHN